MPFGGLDDGVGDALEAEGHLLQSVEAGGEDGLWVGEGVAGLAV